MLTRLGRVCVRLCGTVWDVVAVAAGGGPPYCRYRGEVLTMVADHAATMAWMVAAGAEVAGRWPPLARIRAAIFLDQMARNAEAVGAELSASPTVMQYAPIRMNSG